MNEAVKINTSEIPDIDYYIGCRIIKKMIKAFYEIPENRKGYEEWLKTPDGQRARLLTKEERDAFDAAQRGENV